jgi:hypothetical protein
VEQIKQAGSEDPIIIIIIFHFTHAAYEAMA